MCHIYKLCLVVNYIFRPLRCSLDLHGQSLKFQHKQYISVTNGSDVKICEYSMMGKRDCFESFCL